MSEELQKIDTDFDVEKLITPTPSRGKNTWEISFYGESEDGRKLNFNYQLSITSIPFILRSMKMIETSICIADEDDEVYKDERDFAEIKNRHVAFGELCIESKYTKLQGTAKQLKLTAFITGASIDVRLTNLGGVAFNNENGFINKIGDVKHNFFLPNMYADGTIEFNGSKYKVTGNAWLEKQFIEIPKGRVKKNNTGVVKLNLSFSQNKDRIAVWNLLDYTEKKQYAWATVIEEDGTSIDVEIDPFIEKSKEFWKSPNTGKTYPERIYLEIPNLKLNIGVSQRIKGQELTSNDNEWGQILCSGYFTGKYKGEETEGRCSIEMKNLFI